MSRPPLPMRDGVAPSYLWLPEGQWPDLITFLVARFPDVETLVRQIGRDVADAREYFAVHG